MVQPSPQDTTLRIRRRFAAPREAVFRAWTEPEALKRWWMPRDGFSVPSAEVDLRVGGRYRVTMRNPDGELFALTGTYRDVQPPERLVYTWRWEGTQMGDEETLVTVEFHDDGDATEIVIVHERFPTREKRDRHAQGWNGPLDALARIAPDLPRVAAP